MAQIVKCLPAMWEIRFLSLGWEDPLEKEMATTPVFLPEKFHGQRSLVGYSPRDHKESDMSLQLITHECIVIFTKKSYFFNFYFILFLFYFILFLF